MAGRRGDAIVGPQRHPAGEGGADHLDLPNLFQNLEPPNPTQPYPTIQKPRLIAMRWVALGVLAAGFWRGWRGG